MLLKPGQFALSRSMAAEKLQMSESKCYRLLLKLQEIGNITIKANSLGTVVTVIKWRFYQACVDESEQRMNSEWTANEQRLNNIKKKDKNINNNKKEKSIKKKKGAFAPPSLDEVSDYCRERNNGIDPKRFIDYYEARGWMAGRTKMKDWKAAVRTWENREKKTDDQNMASYDVGVFDQMLSAIDKE